MKRKSDTRQTILLVSLNLFAESGYNTVPMREIAKEANIKAGSIYNHFESKEQILLSLVEYFSTILSHYDPSKKDIYELCQSSTAEQVILRFAYDYEPGHEFINLQFLRLVHQEQYNHSVLQKWLMDANNEKIDTLEYALRCLEELGKIPPMAFDSHAAAAMLNRSLLMLGIEASTFTAEQERFAREKQGLFQCYIHLVTRGE